MCLADNQKKGAEGAPEKAAAASVSSEAFSKAVAQVALQTPGEHFILSYGQENANISSASVSKNDLGVQPFCLSTDDMLM